MDFCVESIKIKTIMKVPRISEMIEENTLGVPSVSNYGWATVCSLSLASLLLSERNIEINAAAIPPRSCPAM